jgi:hydroxymethylglutaryl-CoA lyase
MKLIECPRDAMQGFSSFIPTQKKIKYLNQLLKVGFDTIDIGSFVSKHQIPQLADTAEVLNNINIDNSISKLLVIVGNKRGAIEASQFEQISYIGFPFSISETFQKKNINASIQDSLKTIDEIQNICIQKNKKLVTYFSMAFGNPFGDEWSIYIVAHWAEKLLNDYGVNILSLSDTIGTSNPDSINWLFSKLIKEFPKVEFGAHLHSHANTYIDKLNAAYKAGCRRFDGTILGIGGCPMAKDELVGNMPSEKIIDYFQKSSEELNINNNELEKSIIMANEIFK